MLCGSRKYPIKEPFVELMKGSLNTFLNAFTYPDRTCYPVASTNAQARAARRCAAGAGPAAGKAAGAGPRLPPGGGRSGAARRPPPLTTTPRTCATPLPRTPK